MVFAVLLGATVFSMVFTYSGGDAFVEEFILGLPGEKWTFIFISMAVIFILGFFIDFVEIAFIIVAIFTPIAEALQLDTLWFAILIAMNLQTSFLTPIFGFSLFYLKGVAPPSVRTKQIYKGVINFIILQVIVLMVLVMFPQVFGFNGFWISESLSSAGVFTRFVYPSFFFCFFKYSYFATNVCCRNKNFVIVLITKT